MLEWSTTAGSNILPSPSQTGWSARNQGVRLAGVFYLAAHAGSCYREVSGWCEGVKKPSRLTPVRDSILRIELPLLGSESG
jgi:hypothetical protein